MSAILVQQSSAGSIHRVVAIGATQRPEIEAHLLRLSAHCRRQRFGGHVSDDFLRDYVSRIDFANTLVFGALVEGEIRGLGELRSFGAEWCRDAEAAFTVEKAHRGQGIGSALMQALIGHGAKLGVHEVHLSIDAANEPMLRIVRAQEAHLDSDGSEVHARFPLLTPSQWRDLAA